MGALIETKPLTSDLLWRQLLWLRHGCPSSALYGDDGKMDCNACLIDFRNSSAEEIEARFFFLARERAEEPNVAKLVADLKAKIEARVSRPAD